MRETVRWIPQCFQVGSVLFTVELLAIVVAFLLFFGWNALKVARRDRSARAHLKLAAEIAASEDGEIKSFLRNTLANPHYGVTKCYVFGSVVGQYPTRDVDIVIQFGSSKPGQVRVCRDRLRSIERLFKEHHDRMLHVQTFLCTENEDLDRFLIKAGANECVMDRRSHDGQGLTTGAH